MGEYLETKKAIKEIKRYRYGEDGIPPEVIKRSKIDDIILDFITKPPKAQQVVHFEPHPSTKRVGTSVWPVAYPGGCIACACTPGV